MADISNGGSCVPLTLDPQINNNNSVGFMFGKVAYVLLNLTATSVMTGGDILMIVEGINFDTNIIGSNPFIQFLTLGNATILKVVLVNNGDNVEIQLLTDLTTTPINMVGSILIPLV
jgi:hypothetical protein